jgi:serine/threonine protein kinase
VRQADSIIKFYGSYIHRDEFNVLLEFADKGSLEEYFQRESPPTQSANIIEFWEGLFQLIKGLKTIHSVREYVATSCSRYHTNGCRGHYNVKPESVLVLSNGEASSSAWQFKFADFGLNNSRSCIFKHDKDANEMQDAPAYGEKFSALPRISSNTDRRP